MNDCIFCELREDKSAIIYQNKECFVVLDKYPIEEGHLLIISNDHYADMIEAPDDIVSKMFVVAKKFAEKQRAVLGAAGINIGANIGKEAGQVVMHFHIHVIPRYPGKGRSFDFGHNRKLSPEKEKELVEKLRQ
ncbi:MAG: HIT family protein [Candidatus Marsarchaeota archaeon]|jgi:histidine triad (HIT) family protein|nr:HIT family protein [Candidatus Marsarchaeota archaeon]MCL5418748.1 HIT family protein [Candidatus Marsarchaeota archaeon]